MPQEIEIKIKMEDFSSLQARLASLGAFRRGQVQETNIFFDRPDGSLRGQSTGLRVRFSRSVGESVPVALLTVKGPAGKTGLRSREAFDVTLTPHDQIVPLLRMLGFEQVLLFEKVRETFELDGCLVELDTLPHFGMFVEIEGPSEDAVGAVQAKLGLVGMPPHGMSYSRMVAEYVEREGISSRELRFEGT